MLATFETCVRCDRAVEIDGPRLDTGNSICDHCIEELTAHHQAASVWIARRRRSLRSNRNGYRDRNREKRRFDLRIV